MPQAVHVIRPAPGGDGPFWIVSTTAGADTNVTLGLASLSAAIDQAKTDGAAILGANPVKQCKIVTDF